MDRTADDFARPRVEHGLWIANRFRWALLAALLVFNNLVLAPGRDPVGWANLLLVLGVALAVYVHYLLGQKREIGQREVLVISAVQDLLITAGVWVTGGYDSHLFVLYYPSLTVLALALPLPTTIAYASAVGVVYAALGLIGGGGEAAGGSVYAFAVLVERWLALYVVLGLSAWTVRRERRTQHRTEARVVRLQHTSDELRASLDRLVDAWQSVTAAIDPAALARQVETVAVELGDDCRRIESVVADLSGRALTADHRGGVTTQASRQVAATARDLTSCARPMAAAIEQAHAARTRARDMVAGWSTRAHQVGEISATVRKVADQTNLLAFNANIEAIQAGERGRRFAVVADEVRVVGEQAIEMAHAISSLSAEMWEGTQQVLDAIDELEEMFVQASALTELALNVGTRGYTDAEALVLAAKAAAAAVRDNGPGTETISGAVTGQVATIVRLHEAASRLDEWATTLAEIDTAVHMALSETPGLAGDAPVLAAREQG